MISAFIFLISIIGVKSLNNLEAVSILATELIDAVKNDVCIPAKEPQVWIWSKFGSPSVLNHSQLFVKPLKIVIFEINHDSKRERNYAIKAAKFLNDQTVISVDLCDRRYSSSDVSKLGNNIPQDFDKVSKIKNDKYLHF